MLSENFLSAQDDLLNQLETILAKVKGLGADSAEAAIAEEIAFDNRARHGKIIDVGHSEQRSLGLRAFVGKRKADIGISLDEIKDINALAERVVAMAKIAPEDPYCGLAESTIHPDEIKEIEIYDSTPPNIETLRAQALEAEGAALSHAGITNSEGASTGWGVSQTIHLTSAGFHGAEKETSYYLACSVLAEKNGTMERDYEYCTTHFGKDLPDPRAIGDKAAQRTLERCGASKPKSSKASVIYDPRVARSLLGHFAAAISGAAVARQTSFLKDSIGKKIFNEAITITDDPFRKRGLRSQAFDSEGVLGATQNLIEAGVLQNFLLDSASARQLKRTSTGHAANGSPSPTNLFLQSSQAISPQQMIANMDEGFYITELIGSGVNMVTGDYSRGGTGFFVKNGKIDHPVNEITIVGNLKQMLASLIAADDLIFRYGVDAPTLCVEEMTIAGA